MNSQILCNWLGTRAWPPDHHALLGIDPGETDGARIEQHCQERMAKLRCFQLCHPEEATEGMNRVAQAFISLTEALARSAAQPRTSNGPVLKNAESAADTQQLIPAGDKTAIDWLNAPPPVRLGRNAEASDTPALLPQLTGPPPTKPAENSTQLAQQSFEARRGLATLPALIERVNLTRRVILAWNQAGKFLNNPKRKLTRTTDDVDLKRRLNNVFELTADFPKILGNPGQPGYRVVAMARLEMTAGMFNDMDKSQRRCLARDWQSGYDLLLAYRRFLHAEFKTLRRRGLVQLILQAIRGALNDHPVWVSLGAAIVVALCVAFYRRFF